MKVKIFEVWAVHQGDDDRNSGYPEWFFASEAAARKHAEKRGWYGGDAPVSKRLAYDLGVGGKILILDNRFPEPLMLGYSEAVENQKKRNKALAKLTKEDREVLGL